MLAGVSPLDVQAKERSVDRPSRASDPSKTCAFRQDETFFRVKTIFRKTKTFRCIGSEESGLDSCCGLGKENLDLMGRSAR